MLPSTSANRHLQRLLGDPDEKVVAAALRAITSDNTRASDSLARRYVRHEDPVVRRTAINALNPKPDTGDVALLAEAFEIGLNDRTSGARIAVVLALERIARQGRDAEALVVSRFLSRFPTSDDYLVRRAAERWLPSAASVWGPSRPIETGRGIEDYRDLARDFVLPAERGESRREIVLQTDRGNLTIELFAADAPFTVQSFLRLVDRRHFDGVAWYGVEPGERAESGDRRGDGLDSEALPLRDELNPRQFARGIVALVLDGPDTGGNRFFVTLNPRPGLENTHTAFGRIMAGYDVLDRITLGDRIRRVRRQ